MAWRVGNKDSVSIQLPWRWGGLGSLVPVGARQGKVLTVL